MKTEKKNLGKVSLTCNGKWDIHKSYERLCLVHDGMFASYISKQPVPADIEIENDKYWQPVANLKGDIKLDLQNFKDEFLKFLADVQRKLSAARIVVKDMEERDALTALEAGVGCEVYVLSTKQSWILDKIVVSDGDIPPVKEWHLEADGRIDSVERFELQGEYPAPLTADRALCDAYGNIIHDTYLTRECVHEYVDGLIHDFIVEWRYEIHEGTITWDMLSEALKEMFEATGTSITNFPDEEDITVIDNKLKFKDRKYVEKEFTGKGYKILRKNWMGNINLLEQSMFDQENTVYEIRYLFCLDGKKIKIPDNCVLYFNGGGINNGTVDINQAPIFGIYKLSEFGTAIIEGEFAMGQLLFIDLGHDPMDMCVYYERWRSILGFSLKYLHIGSKQYNGLEEVTVNLSDFPGIENYVTKTELNETLEDYVTDSELSVQLNSLKQEFNSTVEGAKPNLDGYVTDEELERRLSELESGGDVDLSEYYTKTEVDNLIQNSGGSGETDLSNYYTKQQVDDLLDNYYTKEETYSSSEIDEKLAGVSSGGSIDLSGYVKKEEFNKLNQTVTELQGTVQTLQETIEKLKETVETLQGGSGDGSVILQNSLKFNNGSSDTKTYNNSAEVTVKAIDLKAVQSDTIVDIVVGSHSSASDNKLYLEFNE